MQTRGDKRRNRRLIKMVEDLSAQPNESVPQAGRDNAAVQGMYELWSNPRVKSGAILDAHKSSTLDRIEEHLIILAIQDTTELDFSNHPSKQSGYKRLEYVITCKIEQIQAL